MSEVLKNIPAVALRGMTILPSMIVHFDISRDKSIKAVEEAMLRDQKIFVVTQRDPDTHEPAINDLYKIGTLAEIRQVIKLPKNIFRVLVEGTDRAELLDMDEAAGYLEAEIACFPADDGSLPTGPAYEAMVRNLKEIFQAYSIDRKSVV